MTVSAEDVDGWRIFDDAPMSRLQIAAVAVIVALSTLDGYDVLSVTFAAPAITHAWSIGRAALGVVLSSGLAGMALGSFVLAPLADAIGRRALVFGCLLIMATGMLFSAFAHSLSELAGWRIVTGLGIGALVPVITALAAEFTNKKRRSFALAAMAMGFPVGGLIGGLGTALLLRHYGWPATFLAGFVAAILLLPIVVVLLPESPAFLLSRRRPGSLARINAVLLRCGHAPLQALPPAGTAKRTAYIAIFSPRQIGTTTRIALVNILYVMPVYFVLSWLPQMIADAGFRPASASLASAVANASGIVGGVAFGALVKRRDVPAMTVTMMVGLGLAIATFGFTPASLGLLTVAAGICGFFLFAGTAGFFAILATSFASEVRASGSGFVIGAGRVASAGAPLLAGWLFSAGLGRGDVSFAFGVCAALAGATLIFQHRVQTERR